MPSLLALDWHEGERRMHELMKIPENDNGTQPNLSMQAANHIQRAPLLAVGTLDAQRRPWTTIWGGASGLGQPLGNSIVGVKTHVERNYDPVVKALFGSREAGEVIQEQGDGRMVSGLTIDLMTRKRVKIYGRFIAGAVKPLDDEETNAKERAGEGLVQMAIRVEQSLGNCPKYLNNKEVEPAEIVSAELVSDSANLSTEAVKLIRKSNLFFVSSSHESKDMDTNHRGGPIGFVRTMRGDDGKWQIIWPEYSGNRLYQTLGNLATTPKAGLVFPDFETGDVLYITGTTETLIKEQAAKVIARSNLAVRLVVDAALFVRKGLPFRGIEGEPSPYNPRVRLLKTETNVNVDASNQVSNTAKLLAQTKITPTISRFKFTMSNLKPWIGGQWVAFDFSEELSMGYSHMKDDDPRSINDDFVRTFTISSPPAPREKLSDNEFEVTVRNVGVVTDFMSKQRPGAHLEVPILGFGGEVQIKQEDDGKITPIVAGGIGITPLLAQIPALDMSKMRVFWALHIEDIHLALDLVAEYPVAAKALKLYVTGIGSGISTDAQEVIEKLKTSGVECNMRRPTKEDLAGSDLSNRWHICVSGKLRVSLLEWLDGKEVVYEDFNF